MPRENLNRPIAFSASERGQERDVVLITGRPAMRIDLQAYPTIEVAAVEQASDRCTQAGIGVRGRSLVETTQQVVRDPKRPALVALLERVSQSKPWSPRRDWNSVRVAARVSATVPSHALPGHLPFSSCHRIR
jgi:hypothetical protein